MEPEYIVGLKFPTQLHVPRVGGMEYECMVCAARCTDMFVRVVWKVRSESYCTEWCWRQVHGSQKPWE